VRDLAETYGAWLFAPNRQEECADVITSCYSEQSACATEVGLVATLNLPTSRFEVSVDARAGTASGPFGGIIAHHGRDLLGATPRGCRCSRLCQEEKSRPSKTRAHHMRLGSRFELSPIRRDRFPCEKPSSYNREYSRGTSDQLCKCSASLVSRDHLPSFESD
jgi:hypothetical protein